MPKPVRISLDAMGGDHGASVVIPGAALALERHPATRFLMFGNEAILNPILTRYPALKSATEIRHTDVAVAMDEKPSQAIRSGRGKSSMWRAIQAVRDGEADAAVSAGNTGALMAMAKICLKTRAQVERPLQAGSTCSMISTSSGWTSSTCLPVCCSNAATISLTASFPWG